MHRPATFNDMILLAERADQAFMSDRQGILYPRNPRGFGGNRGSFGQSNRGNYSNQGNRQ